MRKYSLNHFRVADNYFIVLLIGEIKMKVLLLVALLTICTVGLTKAAPRPAPARLLIATRGRPDLIQMLKWSLLMRGQAATQLEEALSQRYPFAIDNLLPNTDQSREIAKAQGGLPRCICVRAPCPCDGSSWPF